METRKSFADITRGRTSPGPERSAEDRRSGNVETTSETASLQQGDAATASIHDEAQSRAVRHVQPQYLLFDPGDLAKFIRSVEGRSQREKLSKDVLIGLDERGGFTFHEKVGKKNKSQLANFKMAFDHCLRRLSEIQYLLCGFSDEFVKVADCVCVRDFKAFLHNTMEFKTFTDLYQYEVKMSNSCFEASNNLEEVSRYCDEVGKILTSWYGPVGNKDAYRQYIRGFIDRNQAEFQGNENQMRVLCRVQVNLEKVLDCAETEPLPDLVSLEQRTEQTSALRSEASKSEGAVGFQRLPSMKTSSEDVSLVQSMAGLNIDQRGAESEVASSRTLDCRPKSKMSASMRYKRGTPLECNDANSVLMKEILNKKNALSPIFDSTKLLNEAVQEGKQEKVEQFAGILGRMVQVFVTFPGFKDPDTHKVLIPPGVNQSGSLATIASSGKVYSFFENVLMRYRRMQPEWHTQLDSVCEHFNESLRKLGIDERLAKGNCE
ncbi:hypothetical protein ElyMa_006385400 [Elysia marginata]|uniref:Uncharacterized protein n=1 Tax=Elysia marginata TaxID=1093978 RepID=A0AAV4HS95_9GAST|nr:hypothetical protein ElyMa_006385400 [Elysia marginata]